MRRVIVIECGAAETRAALVIDDDPRLFWFGPARGDEDLPRPPQTGDVFIGRVRSVSSALNGAFIDIGSAPEAFLPLRKKGPAPVEGALVIAMVRRPETGTKGAVLTLDWNAGRESEEIAAAERRLARGEIGKAGARLDAAAQAHRRCAQDQQDPRCDIVVNDPAAKSVLPRAASVDVVAAPFRKLGIEQALQESLEPAVALPQGARLLIHEAEAGVLIDVDSASSADGAGARLNDRINEAAAERIAAELTRRGLGGRIVIDFLPPTSPAARTRLTDKARQIAASIDGARFGRLAPDGFSDLTAPRRNLSLLESATEAAGAGWPVQGRRFTLDWSAKAAIRALETALVARPSSSPRLIVPEETGNYLQTDRPQWKDRLAARYGARFHIQSSPSIGTRRHELIE